MSGLIHVYCGDGKGKTTASLGLAVRACASGYHIVFVQFIKAWETGELDILRKLDNVTVLRGDFPSKFSNLYTQEERAAVFQENKRLFEEAIARIYTSAKTLLILDEIIGTIDTKLIDDTMVYEFLKNKNSNIEVVMTGRNPSSQLIEMADYVSEIKKHKHPYEKGIVARKGIEF